MASGSCDGEDLLKLWRDFLPVVHAVGGYGHHSGHGLDAGPPTAVVFLSENDGDRLWRIAELH